MSKHFVFKLFILFFSIIHLSGHVQAQTETQTQTTPVISKPVLEFRNDSLIVHYKFENCLQGQQFRVWLDITTVEGKKITPKTISGDIGQPVSCGGTKEIVWDMAADSLFLDDVIYVKVLAEADVTVTVQKKRGAQYFFASLLFPGSGLNLKKGNNKPYWLMGVVGYCGVATTLYYNQMKRNAYKDWQTETDAGLKDDYYSDYEDYKKYMTISAASTGAVWLVNLIWTLAAPGTEPGKVSLGNGKNLQFGTTVFRESATPGLTLKYNF
jgi:hypothetical protein